MLRYSLLILTLWASTLYAQELNWSYLNTDNSGLPNQTVKAIAADSKGNIWFGTYMGGLARYDGTNWTVYNTSNSDLPHNYINDVVVDSQDVVWVGTDGGGLARFDGNNWEVFKTSTSGLPSNVVMTIYCDNDGTVWVGTYFGGLAVYNSGLWTVYDDQNSPLLSNKVVAIEKDKNGLVWVGTQGGGIASFDGKNWNVYTERNSKLTNDYIYSITIDNDNRKWIGTGGGGINVFNDVYWIKYVNSNSDLNDDNIRPMLVDPVGNIWVGTYIGGLYRFFDGKWTRYDYQNSQMPDDEITSLGFWGNNLYIGTERSGVVIASNSAIPVPEKETVAETVEPEKNVEKEVPVEVKEETKAETKVTGDGKVTKEVAGGVVATDQIKKGGKKEEKASKNKKTEEKEVVSQPVTEPAAEVSKPAAATATLTISAPNRMVVVLDAADLYFNEHNRTDAIRAVNYLLKYKFHVDNSWKVKTLIYSTNYDVSPQKIKLTDKEKAKLMSRDIIFMDGENTFTEGIKKAFNLINLDYEAGGENQVIAVTYKFIRDDETAKVVVRKNLEDNGTHFTLVAFNTKRMKLQRKMRDIVPRGKGNYYAINKPGIKDNWSFTGQLGVSVFRGDLDRAKTIRFPGVFGIAANKKWHSTGIFNVGSKLQFNFGQLRGEKNGYTFKNNYFEGCLNAHLILNRWINRTFRFETFRPYAFAGIGFITYRTLLYAPDGRVANGIGYDVIENNLEYNGTDPAKQSPGTELMLPVGIGVNYRLDDQFNIEAEASSRFINSDNLDARVRWKDDKYWFFSIGVTYKFRSKPFMADILNK
ncbi:MAG: hypothetical protein Kow00127_05180 [Bacteroidales bacterium]